MSDPIDSKHILQEVLDVLRKYSIPAETFTVQVSIADHDFEQMFPDLPEEKWVKYNNTQIIDSVPSTIRVKRRVPFHDIVQWLTDNIIPWAETLADEIENDFKNVAAQVSIGHHEEREPFSLYDYSYSISVECRHKSEPKIDEGNTAELSIGATQQDDTSTPKFYAYVGWLVDEESGGDWGLDMVLNAFHGYEIYPGFLEQTAKPTLPVLRSYLRQEAEKISQGKKSWE